MIIRITNFCLLCLLLLAAVPLGAQGWDRTYTQLFDDQVHIAHMQSIHQQANGNLIGLIRDQGFNAQITVLKMNANGFPLQRFDFKFDNTNCRGVDLAPTPDGGWLILYEQQNGNQLFNHPYLLRLDGDFQVLWRKALPEGPTVLWDCEANSEGILVYGNTNDANQVSKQVLYHCNSTGDLLSTQLWGVEIAIGLCMRAISPESYVCLGYSHLDSGGGTGGPVVADLTRISKNGTILQQTTLPLSGMFFWDINVTPDKHLMFVGSDSQDVAYVAKLDTNYNQIWQKSHPDFGSFRNVVALPDGSGFWISAVSFLNSPPNNHALRKLDANGNTVLTKAIYSESDGPDFFPYDLIAVADGGAICSGHRGDVYGIEIPRLIRTDAQGNTLTSALSGHVLNDSNSNCVQDENAPLRDRKVIATDADGFEWSGITDTLGQFFIPLMPGAYTVAFKANTGGWVACQDTFQVNVAANDTLDNVQFLSKFAPAPLDSICGIAFQDLDGDCQKDAFEPGYANWPVNIRLVHPINGDTILETTTDAQGHFCLPNLSGFDNSVSGSLWDPYSVTANGETCFRQCVDNFTFNFADSNSVFISIGLRCQESPNCPVMETDVFVTGIRPCIPSGYCFVAYRNSGTATADSASITVSVDTALIVTGASQPWTSRVGNVFTYQLGQVQGGQSGNFSLFVEAPCDDPAGTTYCVEARAYPDTLCQVNTENWDGSEIKVEAECLGDSVQFRIRNIGTGDMQQALEYIVIEDNVLLMSSPGSFQLSAGATTIIMLPATGAFYRLEATQSSGYPGLSDPVAWVEGCAPNGSTVSLGFVNQYELPDEEPWLDIFCAESINSYDPNDKNGFPRGYGEEFFIEPDTDLEYVIRFQNTGNAPAINVEIRDTLPAGVLDPTTVRPGASSHPYTFDIQGNGVLVFRFPLIMLPDSFSDLEGSQGFVKFRVSQQPDLPLGTKIRNDAAIYFDFNAPIITNRTLHTLSRDFIALKDMTPLRPDIEIKASPNPTNGLTTVKVKGVEPETRLRFQLWSLSGRLLRTENFFGAQYSLDMSDLPEGLYLFSIEDENGKIASGKLVKYRP